MFEVKEDGSVTKVEMKDEYSKVEISKTDLTTGKELEGAKLQIIRKDGTVLEEWITDGKPHSVEKLPVNEELTLREITAPDGYEIAEDEMCIRDRLWSMLCVAKEKGERLWQR